MDLELAGAMGHPVFPLGIFFKKKTRDSKTQNAVSRSASTDMSPTTSSPPDELTHSAAMNQRRPSESEQGAASDVDRKLSVSSEGKRYLANTGKRHSARDSFAILAFT